MKYRRISFSLIFLCLWVINTTQIIAAVTTDWGDVINVKYTLFLDEAYTETYNENNTNAILYYIYLSKGQSVPSNVLEMFPEASTTYLEKFEEGLIGLQVSLTKNFMVAAADGYDTGTLAGKNLYFSVTLLEILFDASEQGGTTSTTITNNKSNSNFIEEFGAIMAIVGLIILLVSALIIRGFYLSRVMRSALTKEKNPSSIREATIKKEKSQLKELRELTESYSKTEEPSPLPKEEVKFRRRR